MVDLSSQYKSLKTSIDTAIQQILLDANFINGEPVKLLAEELQKYNQSRYVIPCANGTDALQIALMALNLPQGAEIITPGFSYIAVAEVCHLLGFKPVYVDVYEDTFTINVEQIEAKINANTKAIVPVHLFGQAANMEAIMAIAEKHNLYVIEDNAQSIGASYTFHNGNSVKTGAIGHIGTTSFFPSKNLGCYGDGGALFTNDEELAARIKMIANHGQKVKYIHDAVGVNSRLDTLQAAVLLVKLKELDSFNAQRQQVAATYTESFKSIPQLIPPVISPKSTHVFHQYTLKTEGVDIADFRNYLQKNGVPTMIYYPLPLYKQNAYQQNIHLPITESLCSRIVSLPIGTNMEVEQINHIINQVKNYFN